MSTTEKKSVKSLTSSNKHATKKHTALGRDIIAGLKEGAAFLRGESALPVRLVSIPDRVDVQAIREKLGLSQGDFARTFGFNTRTLQQWEQGRSQPEGAVRAYLTVIARDPHAVEQALGR